MDMSMSMAVAMVIPTKLELWRAMKDERRRRMDTQGLR